ncbi:hypothetical protein [Actinokineospora alba]|uniref:hypothetical protein n=1 Tax=Actinokineospora alba TaxID=504798 RepID=UPI00105CDD0E|nr:hypothetical protein [Actinokineospora alba]
MPAIPSRKTPMDTDSPDPPRPDTGSVTSDIQAWIDRFLTALERRGHFTEAMARDIRQMLRE